MKKIVLTCPEGFTYHSWQRVVAHDEDGSNQSRRVFFALIFSHMNTYDGTPVEGLVFHCSTSAEEAVFVLSGESFSLDDFAGLVRDVMPGVEVVVTG